MRTIRGGLSVLAALLIFSGIASAQQQSLPVARLTLKQAVELALQNSRDLTLAKLQASLAGKNASLDRAPFRPNLYTGTGIEYTSGFPLSPGGGVPTLFELSYNQALFDPLAKGRLRADEALAGGLNASLDSVRDSVMVNTATTYLELTKVRHSLDLLRKERESSQKITDSIRERVGAGYELPIEQTRAELNSAKIEQRIAHDEGREDALASQLRDMLGLLSDQPLDLAVDDLPQAAQQPVADLVAQALASSADVKQAEANQTAKQEILKGARASRWPTISLVGNYSVLSDTNNFSTYFNKFTRNNVNFGIQASIPIYAAKSNAAISLAQTDASVAQVETREKRSQVELRVRAQAHDVRELELGVDVARLDQKLAHQNFDVVQAQFDQGHATLRELMQAQLDENDKLLAFADADFQRQQAELALLQATGQVAKILQ